MATVEACQCVLPGAGVVLHPLENGAPPAVITDTYLAQPWVRVFPSANPVAKVYPYERREGGGWELVEHDDWPVHQPAAPEAPIPGRHWYSGCDPDRPRVNPATGRCEGCSGEACRVCGREGCDEHGGQDG